MQIQREVHKNKLSINLFNVLLKVFMNEFIIIIWVCGFVSGEGRKVSWKENVEGMDKITNEMHCAS